MTFEMIVDDHDGMSKRPHFPTMDLFEWRRLAQAGRASKDVLLRKGSAHGEIKAEGEDRTLAFTISTGSADRDNDTISLDGWDLRHYAKNPVVLWAHDYSALPIGRAMAVTKDVNRLLAKAQFPTPDVYEFAATVYDMLREGYLNATSVGFRPLKWQYNEKRGGTDFIEQELLEFSVVPVAANPEALIEAGKKSYDRARVLRWLNGGSALLAKAMDEDVTEMDESRLRQEIVAAIHTEIAAAVKPVLDEAVMWATGKLPD